MLKPLRRPVETKLAAAIRVMGETAVLERRSIMHRLRERVEDELCVRRR
jgi:hypothetical protein